MSPNKFIVIVYSMILIMYYKYYIYIYIIGQSKKKTDFLGNLYCTVSGERGSIYQYDTPSNHHPSPPRVCSTPPLRSRRRLGFAAADLAVPAMASHAGSSSAAGAHTGSSSAGEAPTTGEHRMGTTIVGVCYEGGVIVGADSRTSTGNAAPIDPLWLLSAVMC
jgi:hypothetical protein